MEPAEKIQRGFQAKSLLQNSFFKEIMNDLDGAYHAKWRTAGTVEEREDCFRFVKVLEQLTQDIQTVAETGRLEDLRLDEWAKAEKEKHVQR